MSESEPQPVALEGSTELRKEDTTPKEDDVPMEEDRADEETKDEETKDEETKEEETKEEEKEEPSLKGNGDTPPPNDETPDVEVTPELEVKEMEEEMKEEESKSEDLPTPAQPKITYVDPKPWMTPKMAVERPVPNAAQVKAVMEVQAGWMANPSEPPEMRFFEYGDNMPKGTNPTKEQVEEIVAAVNGF